MLHVVFASCNIRHEVARVSVQSNGCFHSYSEELTLYKEGNKLIAALEFDGKPTYMTQLSDAKMKHFTSFISELISKKEEVGCTTEDDYLVSINGTSFRFSDGSCDWNGFDKLCKKLFSTPVAEITPP